MTRIWILFLLLASFLIGCASTPQVTPLENKQESGGLQVFATLADFGTFEMELAPAYTRLAMLRHNAAKALRKSQITRNDAISIQQAADFARAKLDESKKLSVENQEAEAKARLQTALEILKLQETRLP